ncbi:hypothetical protein M409DRAFT_62999 [Zasmidium cellare ATCC 36951]|uniref:Protein BFR2 n=1 Tax=Zasmidium cellare ATCC 36951 TaxID=1080233 RepID=A0A6A6D1E7_ZASCE|nr:uncharacterized protein M409DRAFT_62999 [Zasmidium cellare ATCC 36951]KAF2172248.1 hypothetical protein M409DRAFT_62999 [Zasmidium cellare ATCC 36951]
MAPNRGRNRQSEFDEFAQSGAQEFDPEHDEIPDDEDESDVSAEDDGFDGREHYVDVGKSKLRKPKEVALGPQYRGSKVGRQELDSNEDSDDPFDKGFDEDESDEQDLENVEDSHENEDGTDDTDLSEEDEEEEQLSAPSVQAKISAKDRAELREALKDGTQKGLGKSLAQANREEAEKGRAVKRQRTAFDSLLNTRMKLQKSLIATNTMVGYPSDRIENEREDAQQALEAAETAAFNLWSSLNSFREDLLSARTGTKRKRSTFTIDTPTNKLWNHVQSQEAESRPTRDSVLKKWSQKASGATLQSSNRINQAATQTSIIDSIKEQLSNTDHLIKRTQAPRSCAPLQLSKRITTDEKIYDDADFYGLLLKELLEQKSADSVAASNIDIGFQMRREAKTKRNVDTKASKGRKLRYTVHEKLQNFMVPEDRTNWGERQADDLFGSLFGQRLGLKEDVESEDEEMEDGIDGEEAGLLMFRS